MHVDTALQLWSDGQRRLGRADPDERRLLERVADRIVDELRRRLGGPFTTRELADLYSAGTDWCLDVAIATVPNDPRAWDAQTAGDAAFARYVREAADWSGGRRRDADEIEHQQRDAPDAIPAHAHGRGAEGGRRDGAGGLAAGGG